MSTVTPLPRIPTNARHARSLSHGRVGILVAFCVVLAACGFHLRNEASLPTGMERVHIDIGDPLSPLKRDLEAALKRSGAKVENAGGEGIATLKIPVATLTPEILSVGATARVREFQMLYHVELEATDSAGKTIVSKQIVELSRDFTFDETQALGTAAQQDEIKRELGRDMVQTIMRRLEAAGRAH
jgi:LPS-assembly lipoprotein